MADTAADARRGRQHYEGLVRRKRLVLLGLCAALTASFMLDVGVGPAMYSFSDVFAAIVAPSSQSPQIVAVIWEIRMPVALMAVVVGVALSVAGAQMQTILNNPLASPFTLGISAAAGFGASLALALGIAFVPAATDFAVPLNAFVVAMLTALLIHFLSMTRGVSVQTIVLLGIALVFSFNALLALVQYFASSEALAAVITWTMGSLAKATWAKVGITALVCAMIIPLFARRAWALTAMRLGDERAQSLGVDIGRVRLETMILVSILAAIPVSFVGMIGFVGLVGPHIARLLIGEDQRFFLVASALAGGLLLSVSSIVSKTMVPGAILPIGIVTSLVGIPFFISLIFSSGKEQW